MKVLITGTAGFIGFHLAKLLLKEGFCVHGYDGITDYYNVTLKKKRHEILSSNKNFSKTEAMLENQDALAKVFSDFEPTIVVHLAAQAGVRYSLENPRSYIDSNIVGTFNVMDLARRHEIKHLLMASTSSAYGANEDMPFGELQKADTQLTIYAATKKANENMGHSYAHIYRLPTTMFRFFTVYGPWGRPDMALFKFTKGIIEGNPIDIYNNGAMSRDFTYVDDLVNGIRGLIDAVPCIGKNCGPSDSLSRVAPFRIVNIGNSQQIPLLDFIDAIENEVGKSANRNYMPMQTGDVPATHANTALLKRLTGFQPKTDYKLGVKKFVEWYREYFEI